MKWALDKWFGLPAVIRFPLSVVIAFTVAFGPFAVALLLWKHGHTDFALALAIPYSVVLMMIGMTEGRMR